ncbi:MAG: M4 family metallopeptidase [Spirosomataceae bacterium]
MKKIYTFVLLAASLTAFQAKSQCVNFRNYQPAGWDNSIVISAITGTNTSESAFYFNQTLYLDIAIQNNGTCNASTTVKANVFLDGVFKTTLTYPILNSGFFSSISDFMISGSLGVGTHTIQVDIDSPNVIAESNESDNTFTRTFTVQQGACVVTTANTIFNGSRSFNTEHYQDTQFRLYDQCQTAVNKIRDWNSTTTTSNPVEITSGNNSWTSQTQQFGASVMWATKASYNYFSGIHSRNSYNNANGVLDGYVNAVFWSGSAYYTNNASMSNGGLMKVGLSSTGTLANCYGTLDVIGHEYAHAVTASSAALVYQNESGALNESFSDIFGECIENYTLGSNDWLMGANRTSGAIRSMSNPNAYNHPDTYNGTNWFTGTGDNGGVHFNSGVQNYWFYLITQGGIGTNDNGNPFNITGLGITKARAIAYRTLTVNLVGQANATYSVARNASIQSAIDLYGANSTEVNTVTNAWCAVGVGNPPSAVSVSGGGTFCNSTTITASGASGATIYFQGTNSNGTSMTNPGTSQTITSSGTYYFRAINGCGWGTVGSVTVTIVPMPAAVSVAGSGTFCNSTTITASGGAGGTIYFQGTIPNGTFFGSTSLSQVPTSSGTYYFRSYNATCGWGTQGSATVTIQTTPAAVSITGSGTVCNSTTITASGGTGGTIYWQGTTNNGTSTATLSTSQAITASGTYYFRSYNATCGWGPQGSTTITIITSPAAVNVSGGGTICGNSTTLSANGGNGGTVYWQGTNSNGTSTTTPSISQVVTASGTYYFRANNGCGWGAAGSATVTIVPTSLSLSGSATNGLQKAVNTISSNQSIISGRNVSYEAGKSIELVGVFSAANGSVFKAEIKACN